MHPIHPMVVHFPIALLLASTLFDALAFRWRSQQFRETSLSLLSLGILAAGAAVLGLADGDLVTITAPAGAISLLNLLIRSGSAVNVASLFYLTPPTTALIAWAVFGETLTGLALVGMGVTVCGVWLARK